MEMILKALGMILFIYFANGKMEIHINQTYYVPFQALEINCTSSKRVPFDYFEISIETNKIASLTIDKMTGKCINSTSKPFFECKEGCSCSLDNKSVSIDYTVYENKPELLFLCPDKVNTTILRAETPANVSFNASLSVEVNESESLGPIYCKAECIPECIYKWTGPDDFARNNAVLHINDTQSADSGIYTCIAVNVLGEVKANLNFTVKYGPKNVTLDPSIQMYTIEEGKPLVSIFCSSQCYPECTKTWTGPGISSFTSVLNLPSINRNNSGQFICTVTNHFGTLQTAIKVIVQYGPAKVSINESTVTLKEGGHVGPISCSANCVPDCIYRWIGPDGYTKNGSILNIDNVLRKHNGTYICIAMNTYNTSSGNCVVLVQYGPHTITLNSSEEVFILKEGNRFGPLLCAATCNPKCDIKWTGPGIFFPDDILHIASVSRNNTGLFVCNASNDVGKLKKTVSLTVQYAARVILINVTHSDDDYVAENSSLQFVCEATGEPEPTVTWWYSDMSGSTISVSSSNMFTIQKASCNATGIYTCKAINNGFLPHNTSKHINVTCGPKLYEYCSKCKNDGILAVKRNESESVSACFLSNPQPKSNWTINDVNNSFNLLNPLSQMYNQSTFMYTTSVGVTLVETNEVYVTLSVENFVGFSSTTCRMRIEDKPFKPKLVNVNCREQIIIQWVSNFNGGIQQVFLVHYFETNATVLQSAENISDKGENEKHVYELTDLKPNTKYLFYIEAINNIDSTKSEVVTCTTASASSLMYSLAAVGGGITAGIACIIALVIGLLFHKRRISNKSIEKDKSPLRNHPVIQDEDEDAYGLRDNPIYGSRDGKHVEYSVVSNQRKRQQEYENSDDFTRNTTAGICANPMSMKQMPKKDVVDKFKKNKDGLIYADLDLAPCGSKFVVRGIENKTNYAMIDLTKTADPLPSSDEDDNKHTEK